ncbi:MAG: UDP-N-acetylmuramate dehydrogenase [Eubacteriales bacterium]|nr:UDP-N-acetylmuramate dehydrogenase [Eubacteriales bacterium]
MNLNNIRKIITRGRILEQEPMAKHTTFRAGGSARYFITPATRRELAGLVRYLYNNGIDYFVMGNGSNLLVSDAGYDGVVIDLGKNDGTEFTMLGIDDGTDAQTDCAEGEIIFDAGAGCLMSAIGNYAKQFCASGFECLSGIPGCLGGALAMNAGAYGSEMKDIVRSVLVVTPQGELETLSKDALSFRYRGSSIMDNGYIAARTELSLKKGEPEAIAAKMEECAQKRREKQPLEFPSAGSTFKRPEGMFAGQLIEEAGLKGLTVGGAQVSEKHAGFVINRDHASAADIYELIRQVQERVYAHSGVELVPEVRMLGRF